MAKREELVPYSLWRHVQTESWYVVVGIALNSTNGPEEHKQELVVYVSLTHEHLCCREIGEFLDGRFERGRPE